MKLLCLTFIRLLLIESHSVLSQGIGWEEERLQNVRM